MPEFIYVEAVNLDNVIEDTEDLSTRRAGGYMLLEMVHRVDQTDGGRNFHAVTLGASAGLLELHAGVSMSVALAAVDKVLSDPLYSQATTIVVNTRDEVIENGDCQQVRERLIAAVRRKQMQSLSMVTAFAGREVNWPAPEKQVCEVDGVRPAVAQMTFKKTGDSRSQSRSVTLRREEGRTLRQRFYGRELAHLDVTHHFANDNIFTDEFDELARFHPGWGSNGPPALLEHKIAVFYADGNGFGRVARDCADWGELRGWDRHIQAARRSFLHQLLIWIRDHRYGLAQPVQRGGQDTPPRLRVETLMWGGDELMLVVPAWLALEAVQCFFRTCRVVWPEGQRRTHSVGLVLAHRNAPISSLKKLAKGLAEQGKSGSYQGQDSLNWIVLESFDHAGSDLSAFWRLKGMPKLTWADMALNPLRLDELLARLPALAAELPRSSLYRIVHSLASWSAAGTLGDDSLRLLSRAYDNVQRAVATRRDDWAALWKALQPKADLDWPATLPTDFANPEHLNAWLTLVELWDYAAFTAAPTPAVATSDQPLGESV